MTASFLAGIGQIHLNIFPITCQADCMRESTYAIIALVVETTLDQIIPLNNTFSTTSKLFTPNIFSYNTNKSHTQDARQTEWHLH